MKKRIHELERLLGRNTVEVEILKAAIHLEREKADLAHALALRGRFPMERIAEALDVTRSRLSERMGAEQRKRPPRYPKAADAELLPLIREIIDGRLTYGYRRVCAVLNRRLAENGRAAVNH